MAELGVGIIGLGRMGWLHAEHLHGTIRGARLIAAAVDDAHRRQLEASGDVPCPLVADVDALVADPRIDAVVVVSPTSLHHEHIQLAAANGKAIFAEKPLADSVERARETAAAVQRAGVPFQIGFQRRFDPGYARARQLIDAGEIGTVEMFRGLTCDRMPPVSYLRTSGGLFWDLGIHDFDAARFLMKDDVVDVTAAGSILIEPDLAEFDDVDHGVVVLRFRRGGIGVVQNAWRAPYGYDIRAEVHGSIGKVVTDLDERVPTRLYGPAGFTSERHFLFVERFAEAYRLELQAFVDAVIAGRAPTPGIDDALQAVLISDAATRSRQIGASVAIDSR
ncbi:MAG: myo-inositol 2-dehydrogenase / D-chiro-inositol 1-dehydrogenase [Thermomicrobiales bacterium]|jgi:myo-inositol 2-dehydrogenase/D-chiro-inositol 1-dehydrogenase|nr:myo-inositol 2-dehydrogenase / D-chiro-inositol 1-dehydrogenase [Thermomicrobiales bacterium]